MGSGSSLPALLAEVGEDALLLEQRVDLVEELVGVLGDLVAGGSLGRCGGGVGRVLLGQGFCVLARQIGSRLTRCHRDAPSSAHGHQMLRRSVPSVLLWVLTTGIGRTRPGLSANLLVATYEEGSRPRRTSRASVRQRTPPPAFMNSLTGDTQMSKPQPSRMRPTRGGQFGMTTFVPMTTELAQNVSASSSSSTSGSGTSRSTTVRP